MIKFGLVIKKEFLVGMLYFNQIKYSNNKMKVIENMEYKNTNY